MKKNLRWFKALPVGCVTGLIFLYLVRKIFRIPVSFTFSQGGEDILTNYLSLPEQGTYVDVGCNDPIRFSNTFNLYLRGWRGINVDANSELIEKCRSVRKEDISICAAVSDTEKEVTFYQSKVSAVSTIDEERVLDWKEIWPFAKEDEKILVTKTITSILDGALSSGSQIDILSIDVEGHDFNVLKGLDFTRYRPKVIIIELHSIDGITETDIYKFLFQKEYQLKYYAVLNAYFVDAKPST